MMRGDIEFSPTGPRRVWQDDRGPFIKWEGARLYDRRLVPYIGDKVHVLAFLDGSGFEISEWLDRPYTCLGGWRKRAGELIVTDGDLRVEEWHKSRLRSPEGCL